MREARFDPLGNSISAVGEEQRRSQQAGYDADQCKADELNPVTDFIRSGEHEGAEFGGEKNGSDHEHGETAYVEDTLDRPYGDLGGEGQILAACDQVGANHFSGAAEESER